MSFYKLSFILLSVFFLNVGCSGKSSSSSAVVAHSVDVTVSGLSGTLKLMNNGGDELTFTKAGADSFSTKLSQNETYRVTISSEPTGQVCDVVDGNGMATANVSVTVQCATSTATLRTDFASTTGGECKGCHSEEFRKWEQSGHGYKMNKVDGEIPIFPFSNVSNMFPTGGVEVSYTTSTGATITTPITKETTSYIIGGYGWKGRYFDANGYLLYGGTNAQYNINDGTFSGYNNSKDTHDSAEDGKVAYKCGFCHTTGWKAQSGNEVNRGTTSQDDLEGMLGSWDFAGVTCQRCHGTLSGGSDKAGGVGHNTKLMSANVYDPDNFVTGEGGSAFGKLATTNKANSICADCHLRNNYVNKVDVDTGKGLMKHHEQGQELYVGRHGNLNAAAEEGHGDISCVTCHDPHSSVRYDSIAKGEGVYKNRVVDGNCAISCHSANAANSTEEIVSTSTVITVSDTYKEHTCVDCHMPQIVSSAIAIPAAGSGASFYGKTPVPGVTALGIPNTGNKRGDIRSHVLSLSTTSDPTFLGSSTVDGTSAQVKIPVEFSCMTCHGTGGTKGPTTAAEAVSQLTTTKVH